MNSFCGVITLNDFLAEINQKLEFRPSLSGNDKAYVIMGLMALEKEYDNHETKKTIRDLRTRIQETFPL